MLDYVFAFALWSVAVGTSLELWKFLKRRTRNHLQEHFQQTRQDWQVRFDELNHADNNDRRQNESRKPSDDSGKDAVPAPPAKIAEASGAVKVDAPASSASENVDNKVDPELQACASVDSVVAASATAAPINQKQKQHVVEFRKVPDALLNKLTDSYVSKLHQRVMIASLSVAFVTNFVFQHWFALAVIFGVPTWMSLGYNALAVYEYVTSPAGESKRQHGSWFDGLPTVVKSMLGPLNNAVVNGGVNFFNSLPSDVKHHSVTLCALLFCTLPWSWSSMVSQQASNAILFAYLLLEASNYALHPSYVLVKKYDFVHAFVGEASDQPNSKTKVDSASDRNRQPDDDDRKNVKFTSPTDQAVVNRVMEAYMHKLLVQIRESTNEQMMSIAVTRFIVMPVFWFVSNIAMVSELSFTGHIIYMALSSLLLLVGPAWYHRCYGYLGDSHAQVNHYRSKIVAQSREFDDLSVNSGEGQCVTRISDAGHELRDYKLSQWVVTVQLEYLDSLMASKESNFVIDLFADLFDVIPHVPQMVMNLVDELKAKYWKHVKPE